MIYLLKLAKMPISVAIIAIWIIIWLLVTVKDLAPMLAGKGLAQIGSQYYRLITAGLTHKNVIHLIINVCTLFFIGQLYEGKLGSIKFLIVGVLCAVLTQLIFLAIYSNTGESIGGSAYNFALCGFVLTTQMLNPEFPKLTLCTWSGNWLLIYLIGSNIPLLSFINISTIVFHLVAFILGAVTAVILKVLNL